MGAIELASLDHVGGSPLLLALDELELDRDDFVIFGSGPMLAKGLRNPSDLDIVARGESWRWARRYGEPTGEQSLVRFRIGAIEIEIGPKWYSPPDWWETDSLIDDAQLFSGYRFARLEDVLRYKKKLGRPKDALDIALIEAYLRRRRSEP